MITRVINPLGATMLLPASTSDLTQLAQIKPGFGEADVQARFKWLSTVDVTWYVWWVEQVPLGWALIQWQGKPTAPTYPDLFDLFVHSAWRGQGIGTHIIAACEKIVRERGYMILGLAVNPDLNPRAMALYQRLGYKVVRHEKYLDGVYDGVEDWVIDLKKNLSNGYSGSTVVQ